MPRVPTYDSFTVAPTAPPAARFDTPNIQQAQVVNAGDFPAALNVEVGNQLTKLSNQQTNIALEIQNEANTLRVDDALNQAKETATTLRFGKDVGYNNVMGLAALQRESGKPLADEYSEKLQDNIGNLAKGLGNDVQRMAFMQKAGSLVESFRSGAIQHESQQFRDYSLSVREGSIKNATNRIGLNYNNPNVINDEIKTIEASTASMGRTMGKSAEWIQARTRELTSGAHAVAVEAALEGNDPFYAQSYMRKYAKDMTAQDILKLDGAITKQVDGQISLGISEKVMQGAMPKLLNQDQDRAFNILIGTESGGRQFDDQGKPLTSSAGAIGRAQVMPTTGPEAAKLAGLQWDEDKYKNDADYNTALGKAYFNQQLKDFNGNLAHAYAAYNAGPSATRKAIAQAKTDIERAPAGTEVANDYWLTKLPGETQNYVAKNMGEYDKGGGKFAKPSLGELQAQARAELGPNATPARLKQVYDQVEIRFKQTESALKARDEQAVATVQQELINNGGDFNSLPASMRSAIPPGKFDQVLTFASKLAKGDAVKTDWGLYYELKSNPAVLGQTNLMAFRDKFNDTEFKNLVEEQGAIREGKQSTISNLRTVREEVNSHMSMAGIDPTPKDTNKKNVEKVAKVWATLEGRVRDMEGTLGRKATQDEIRKEAARMFTSVEVYGSIWNSDTPAFQVEDNDRVIVPEPDRTQITFALKQAKKPVNDATIESLYRARMGIVGKQ